MNCFLILQLFQFVVQFNSVRHIQRRFTSWRDESGKLIKIAYFDFNSFFFQNEMFHIGLAPCNGWKSAEGNVYLRRLGDCVGCMQWRIQDFL